MAINGERNMIEWWRKHKPLKEAYRRKLIAKGVLDGSNKINELMSRKFLCKGF